MDRTTAIETLRAGIKRIQTSEEFLRYLDFSNRFHDYSLRNTFLIYFQRPDATYVAGFQAWLKLGRWVRKGEKGIAILAPMVVKRKDEETGQEARRVVGFRVVHVFDVSQTDGAPLPENPAAPQLLVGEDGAEIFDDLADWVRGAGVDLRLEADSSIPEANGSYTPSTRTIRIRPDLAPTQRAKTLVHEVAHWILHSSEDGAKLARHIKETEAEAVAYLVCAHLGLATGQYSFGYVAEWSAEDPAALDRSLSRITKAADEIVIRFQSLVGSETE